MIQKAAREYLRPTNRTILTIAPKGKGTDMTRTRFVSVMCGAALLAAPSVLRGSRLRNPISRTHRRRSRRRRSPPRTSHPSRSRLPRNRR